MPALKHGVCVPKREILALFPVGRLTAKLLGDSHSLPLHTTLDSANQSTCCLIVIYIENAMLQIINNLSDLWQSRHKNHQGSLINMQISRHHP